MSEQTVSPPAGATSTASRGSGRSGPAPDRRGSVVKWVLLGLLLVFLLVFPLYFDEFWLRTGFAVFGAAIGAIGLNLLVGTTGQLSLAHAFFLAVGAVSYTYISGESGGLGTRAALDGLGLPPIVGMVVGKRS